MSNLTHLHTNENSISYMYAFRPSTFILNVIETLYFNAETRRWKLTQKNQNYSILCCKTTYHQKQSILEKQVSA